MKKLFKFAAGVAAIAGAACGAVYCLKKFCGIDLLKRDEDFDNFDEEFDDDFDDDFEDDDEAEDAEPSNDDEAGDREYVTLDMESEDTSDDSEKASEDDEKSDE